MTKAIVTGGGGFIGSYVLDFLSKTHEVYSLDVKPCNKSYQWMKANITDFEKLEQLFLTIKPEVIVHTAAMKNVRRCEKRKQDATLNNVNGTRNIAKLAEMLNSFVVYVSSDQVFDGKKGLYSENDDTHPLNQYGKTKLKGEKVLLDINPDAAIVRTAMVYGAFPNHLFSHVKSEMRKSVFEKVDQSLYPQFVANNLLKNKEVSAYIDRYNSPTYVKDLAEGIYNIIQLRKKGMYHIAGSHRVSRYDFANEIAKCWNLDNSLIKPAEYNFPTKRPKDCSMNVIRAEKNLNMKLNDISSGLKLMKSDKDEYLSSILR